MPKPVIRTSLILAAATLTLGACHGADSAAARNSIDAAAATVGNAAGNIAADAGNIAADAGNSVAGAASNAAAATGLNGPVSQVPIRLGYYVATTDQCGTARMFYKYEAGRAWAIPPEGATDSSVSSFAFDRVTHRGDTWTLHITGATEDVDSFERLIVRDREHMTISAQDDVAVRYCADEQVPAGVRSQVRS